MISDNVADRSKHTTSGIPSVKTILRILLRPSDISDDDRCREVRGWLSMECRESYTSVDVDIECCRSRWVAGYKRREESDYFKCKCKRRQQQQQIHRDLEWEPARFLFPLVLSLLLFLRLVLCSSFYTSRSLTYPSRMSTPSR